MIRSSRIRALAFILVAAGGLTLGVPRPAIADGGEVCCQVDGGPRCCGGACNATKTSCEACTTWLGCLLF